MAASPAKALNRPSVAQLLAPMDAVDTLTSSDLTA
jgi:hypothetical protein